MRYRSNLKSLLWIVLFFVILATLVIPTIVLGSSFGFEVSMAIQAAIILAATAICQLLRKEKFANISGTIDKYWFRQFMAGSVVGLVIMAVPAMFLLAIGAINFELNNTSAEIFSSAFQSCAAVAIAEEFLFRGFIFQRLIQSLGKPIAQILISSLFLLTHMNNPGMTGSTQIFAMANIFIASLLFGMAFTKTGSLALPIGIHFMANFIQGTVMGFGVSGNHEESLFVPMFIKGTNWFNGGQFGIEASVPGLLVLIIVLAIVFHFPIKSAKVSLEPPQ
jgi:uncharacterized protein